VALSSDPNRAARVALASHVYTRPLVTVPAHVANDLPKADSVRVVDMRGGNCVRAGTFAFEGTELVTNWHAHDLHQIEYAFRGTVEVETGAGHYLLPPQQAAWIPAGLMHQTTIKRTVRTVSVFFHPDLVPEPGDTARILAAAPVIREMILYGVRWPIGRPVEDPEADAYFVTLANLVADGLDRETPLCLPTSAEPLIAAVMAYTDSHLDHVTEVEVCRSVGLSDRTLRRRFVAATGMTWRSYLLQSRFLRAMALLAEPGPTVIEVATAVGFESLSAFSRGFARYVGENPTAYRHRVLAGADHPISPRTSDRSSRRGPAQSTTAPRLGS
jgi:AraC-like DNA-binding protein/quercetin dioxygenase-like cupin family protein